MTIMLEMEMTMMLIIIGGDCNIDVYDTSDFEMLFDWCQYINYLLQTIQLGHVVSAQHKQHIKQKIIR